MSEGLLRQRRNLITISCVMIFLKFAEVEIEKLSLLGIDFGKIGNPAALYIALWITFWYFLFRYYQYFVQEGRWHLFHEYHEILEKFVKSHMSVMAKNVHPEATYYPHQLVTLKRESWNVRIAYHEIISPETGEQENKEEYKTFPFAILIKYRVFSAVRVSLNTSAVTDYLLPFMLASIVLIYCFNGCDSCLVESISEGVK